MSLGNIALRSVNPTSEWTTGLRVYEMDDGRRRNVQLSWTTEYADCHESFTITVFWRGWYRGRPIQSSWSDAIIVTIPVSKCSKTYDGKLYRWYTYLDFDYLRSAIAGQSFDYRDRLFDQIELSVTVWSNYQSWYTEKFNQYQSNHAKQTLWIGYFPMYVIEEARYEKSNWISLYYTTTWERNDDRFCIDVFYDYTEGRSVLAKTIWGTVSRGCKLPDQKGLIEFSTENLLTHVKDHQIRIVVRFNASYRPVNLDFAEARVEGFLEDGTICNTPYLEFVPTPQLTKDSRYCVNIKATDTGDLFAPIEFITIKMRDGKYKIDEMTVKPGEIASFRFCPFNTPLVFDAIASRGQGTSKQVSIAMAGVRHESNSTVITSVDDPSVLIDAEFNQDFSVSTEAEKEIVKLAGRARPSAFYGDGGSTTMTFGAILIDDDAIEVEHIPESGDFVIRLADGRRYALSGNASLSWDHPRFKQLTISGEEVDA